MAKFQYPVSIAREGLSVTAPMFETNIFENNLFVELDDCRKGGDYDLSDIPYRLGIENDALVPTSDYVKILYSGHIGCGKTVELKRLHNSLNSSDKYLSVFISVEDELVYSRFEPEDFYVLLITRLIHELEIRKITHDTDALGKLANLLTRTTIREENIKEVASDKAELNTGIGVNFMNLFKLGLDLKTTLASENESVTKFRSEIRTNLLHIIQLFNTYLTDVRAKVKKQNQGKDILFIIDGFEKIQLDKYQKVIIQDANALIDLQCNLIVSVPINTFYSMINKSMTFSYQYVVSMVNVKNDDAIEKLKTIVGKRIDLDTFFENNEAINLCVKYSGGCIRQLFEIVNNCIMRARGTFKIDTDTVEYVADRLGGIMRERLETEHLEIIKKGSFQPADEPVSWMLYGLILLKYNGIKSIKLNPLLEKYMKNAGEIS